MTLRQRLEERHIWFHVARERDPKTRLERPLWREGRAWLHLSDRRGLSAEWGIKRNGWGIGFDLNTGDGDNGIQAHVRLGWIYLFVGIDGVLRPADHTRNFSLSLIDEYVHGEFAHVDDNWYHPAAWAGWHFMWNYRQWLFGRLDYRKEQLETRDNVPVYLPEGVYLARVEMTRATWKYRRLPWPSRVGVFAEVTPHKPVPVEGKGESEWDCGEDAIMSSHCEACDCNDAAAKFAASVMERRDRYGVPDSVRAKYPYPQDA